MEFTFTNGTARQQRLFNEALGYMWYPHTRIDSAVDVDFEADPDPHIHNEFAITQLVEGSSAATIQIKRDLDDLDRPQPFTPPKFFYETVVHEIGHVVQGRLTDDQKTILAGFFNTDLADYNSKRSWEDTLKEGIAETFKDVFLPRAFRRFSNRTNRKLPSHRIPAFRRFFVDLCYAGQHDFLRDNFYQTTGPGTDPFQSGWNDLFNAFFHDITVDASPFDLIVPWDFPAAFLRLDMDPLSPASFLLDVETYDDAEATNLLESVLITTQHSAPYSATHPGLSVIRNEDFWSQEIEAITFADFQAPLGGIIYLEWDIFGAAGVIADDITPYIPYGMVYGSGGCPDFEIPQSVIATGPAEVGTVPIDNPVVGTAA